MSDTTIVGVELERFAQLPFPPTVRCMNVSFFSESRDNLVGTMANIVSEIFSVAAIAATLLIARRDFAIQVRVRHVILSFSLSDHRCSRTRLCRRGSREQQSRALRSGDLSCLRPETSSQLRARQDRLRGARGANVRSSLIERTYRNERSLRVGRTGQDRTGSWRFCRPQRSHFATVRIGRGGRVRTHDLRSQSPPLSQLSYSSN